MAATFPIKKVCTKPGMVQFTILRLEARQRTLFAWQDAEAITATLVGTGNWTVTSPVRETGDVLFAAESGETRAVIEDYKPVMALELSIDEAC